MRARDAASTHRLTKLSHLRANGESWGAAVTGSDVMDRVSECASAGPQKTRETPCYGHDGRDLGPAVKVGRQEVCRPVDARNRPQRAFLGTPGMARAPAAAHGGTLLDGHLVGSG